MNCFYIKLNLNIVIDTYSLFLFDLLTDLILLSFTEILIDPFFEISISESLSF
jgi:hypothetical protein